MKVKCMKCGAIVTVEADVYFNAKISNLENELIKLRREFISISDDKKYWKMRCERLQTNYNEIESAIRSLIDKLGIEYCNVEHEII